MSIITPERTLNALIMRIAFLTLSIVLLAGPSRAAPENLEEMRLRAARHASATWGPALCEDPRNGHSWQPESLMYHDVTTGREVWRLSATPSRLNMYHSDIGMNVWSADGKRLAFVSDRDTGAFPREEFDLWMVVDSKGSNLRPVVGGPTRVYSHTLYFHWSPQIPDVYYEFARADAGITGVKETDLYKATVSDTGVTRSRLLAFPSSKSSQLCLSKTLSACGRRVLALTWDDSWVFPATIYPESGARVDDPDGYSINRKMAGGWGDTPSTYSSLHDHYYPGDGTWHFALPSGSHSWWRIKVLGSAPDGGALYTFLSPNRFDEAWPENTSNKWGGVPDPFGSQYWSHLATDRWGRHAIHSNGDANPMGPAVWDIQRHRYVVSTFGGGAQYHDWSGFTDFVASSRGGVSERYQDDRIYVARYNDPASQEAVAYTHNFFNQGGAYGGVSQYSSLTRPSQSPDGTKIAFHSSFLNGTDSSPDIFWAVAHYPLPPTDLGARQQNGVRVEWLPPRYTRRGWPYAGSRPAKDGLHWPVLDGQGLEVGEPIQAREIRRYHLWRSPTGNDRWQEVGAVAADYSHQYSEDSDLFMLHPVVNNRRVGESNKVSFTDNPGNGKFFYALTAEEHSGLESEVLSEVLEVSVSGATVTSRVVQPQGQKDFWRTAPPAPSPSSFKVLAGGNYRLTWTEPNSPRIRHYNVYYSPSGPPPVSQTYRIASVPVGTSTYLDWLADRGRTGFYLVTSVDRQGNEGSSPSIAPAAPANLRIAD